MRHVWGLAGLRALFPGGGEVPRELTSRDLVDFGEHAQIRLPAALIHALAKLRQDHSVLCRAALQMGEEAGQKVAHLTLKVVPWCLNDRETVDAIYEAVEGAGTERLMIRAHLVPQNVVYQRDLTLDADELFDTVGRGPDERADPEEAWVVTTLGEMFDDHFEETDSIISAWQVDCGIAELPHLMTMKVLAGRQVAEHHAVELPEATSLGQARVLAQRLGAAREMGMDVMLTQRTYEPPARPTSVYESVREMAQRLKTQQESLVQRKGIEKIHESKE